MAILGRTRRSSDPPPTRSIFTHGSGLNRASHQRSEEGSSPGQGHPSTVPDSLLFYGNRTRCRNCVTSLSSFLLGKPMSQSFPSPSRTLLRKSLCPEIHCFHNLIAKGSSGMVSLEYLHSFQDSHTTGIFPSH